ncbi:hypothetical protein J6590_049285 [Homalodisca vitripennis]|nr:hypothetical protein J6590_049285 [Homalodisca vitripennis]
MPGGVRKWVGGGTPQTLLSAASSDGSRSVSTAITLGGDSGEHIVHCYCYRA